LKSYISCVVTRIRNKRSCVWMSPSVRNVQSEIVN